MTTSQDPHILHTPRGALIALAGRMDCEVLDTQDAAVRFVRDVAEEYPGGQFAPAPDSATLADLENLTELARAVGEDMRRHLGDRWCDPADVIRDRGLLMAITQAIGDPGSFLPRGDDYQEPVTSWSARAVLLVVHRVAATVAEEATRL